jgi:hypothetical protein
MKIAKAMFFSKAPEGKESRLKLAPMHMFCMAVLAVPTVVLGLYWAFFKGAADQAIMRFTSM